MVEEPTTINLTALQLSELTAELGLGPANAHPADPKVNPSEHDALVAYNLPD